MIRAHLCWIHKLISIESKPIKIVLFLLYLSWIINNQPKKYQKIFWFRRILGPEIFVFQKHFGPTILGTKKIEPMKVFVWQNFGQKESGSNKGVVLELALASRSL